MGKTSESNEHIFTGILLVVRVHFLPCNKYALQALLVLMSQTRILILLGRKDSWRQTKTTYDKLNKKCRSKFIEKCNFKKN